MAKTKTKGDTLVEKLRTLDDGVARSVPIAERHVCTHAANVIQRVLDEWDIGAMPEIDWLFDPEEEPTKSATSDLEVTDEAPETDPENIYDSPTMRQSIEEDRK